MVRDVLFPHFPFNVNQQDPFVFLVTVWTDFCHLSLKQHRKPLPHTIVLSPLSLSLLPASLWPHLFKGCLHKSAGHPRSGTLLTFCVIGAVVCGLPKQELGLILSGLESSISNVSSLRNFLLGNNKIQSLSLLCFICYFDPSYYLWLHVMLCPLQYVLNKQLVWRERLL